MKIGKKKIFVEFVPLIVNTKEYDNEGNATPHTIFLLSLFNLYIMKYSIQIDILFWRIRIINDSSKGRKNNANKTRKRKNS